MRQTSHIKAFDYRRVCKLNQHRFSGLARKRRIHFLPMHGTSRGAKFCAHHAVMAHTLPVVQQQKTYFPAQKLARSRIFAVKKQKIEYSLFLETVAKGGTPEWFTGESWLVFTDLSRFGNDYKGYNSAQITIFVIPGETLGINQRCSDRCKMSYTNFFLQEPT